MGKREKDTGEMGERPADPGVDPAAVEPLPRSVRAAWIGATATLNAGDQEADEALRATQQQLQAIFDSLPDHLMLLDREHRIQMINHPDEIPDPEALLGKPLYERAPPEQRQEAKRFLDQVVQSGDRLHREDSHTRPDGSVRQFSTVAAPVKVDGAVIGSVVSARDVTEQRQLWHEKQQLEEQYHQSQKMEAIGRLAGGVAHDFNNMLSVVQGNAEAALMGLDGASPVREPLEEIAVAARRAAGLTSHLLAFSRRQVIEPRTLDLNQLVDGLHGILARLIGEDIVLQTRSGEGRASVHADPGQVEQVLLNLAVNARDAMPGGGTLTIQTGEVTLSDGDCVGRAGASAGRHVRLSVQDPGCGMSPEVMEKIFEPFFTTKEQGRGTGLCLATVFGVVKQHGGWIEVDTAPDRGSTFDIFFPRTEEAEESPGEPPPSRPRGDGETVLLAEDEESVRRLVVRLLGRLGYEVIATSSGEAALAAAAEHDGPIHLLFTDVIMPGMNGHELARKLADVRAGVPVLYMSGYDDDILAPHGVMSEDVVLLAKPFSIEDLAQHVREALDS